jgi:tetratricopeptide (TPR) repeat protein
MEVYRKVLETNPGSLLAANNLAFYYAEYQPEEGRLEEALKLIERPLKERPDAPSIVDTAAWIHFRMGNLEKARDLMLSVEEKIGDEGVLNYHLGMIYLGLGEKEKAASRLKTAVESEGDYPGKEEARKALEGLG